MIRITLFIIALLLVVDAIQPSPPWLVTLAVLSGIEAFRFRHWWFDRVPAVLPLTVFVISLLLAVEAVDVTDGWLVALAVLTGIDMARPHHFGRRWWPRERWRGRRMRRAWAGADWDDDW